MSHVISQIDGRVGIITLNNPEKHNAFDDALIADLTGELKSFDENGDVRVVVLSAAGKSFSAGGDLNWMKRTAGYSAEENLRDATALAELMRTLHGLSKPTIARVQGAAYGGGVGLVACCDIAVGTLGAMFCLSEAKLGLIPAVISPYVVAAIGQRAAHRYFLTAERFDAAEAFRLGLLHELAPDDDAMDDKSNDKRQRCHREEWIQDQFWFQVLSLRDPVGAAFGEKCTNALYAFLTCAHACNPLRRIGND